MYRNHIKDFIDIDHNAISSKYSIYTWANSRDNVDPIVSPSSCRYM